MPRSFRILLHTTHGQADEGCKAADLGVGEEAMALDRFFQLILIDCADVLRPGYAVLAEASFSGAQKEVPGAELGHGGRKRNGQHGLRAGMRVSPVCRDNDGGTVLARLVGGEVRPPNLSAKRGSRGRRGHGWAPAESISTNMLGPAISAHSLCSASSSSEAVS